MDMTLIKDIIVPIVVVMVGCTGFFSFVQFLITRRDTQKGTSKRLTKIDEKLDKCERDNCRTQMLLLMYCYPNEQSELMRVSQHYFEHLHGDWYMTGIFNKYLEKNGIGKPEWFNTEG